MVRRQGIDRDQTVADDVEDIEPNPDSVKDLEEAHEPCVLDNVDQSPNNCKHI